MIYNIAQFYDELCKNCELGWQAAGWMSEENQYANFVLISSIISPNSSVLDVGCGQGDFYNYIKNNKIQYYGIDISELMIKKAKQTNPNVKFFQKDFLEEKFENFDYVIASGAFSFKTKNQYEYIENCIEKCYKTCNKAAALTVTSELADIKYDEPLFYYSPIQILEIALKFTPYIIINTSSLPNELVLFLYKN
jgi:SAM-dependent methyltransferase